MSANQRTKIVRCCHCRGMMRVAARALSVFCPHCQKRAPLESLRIIGSHPGRTLATCGDIFIEPTASLNLCIRANNVVIQGRLRGPVFANETAEIGPTACVIGDIRAAKIIVHDGAVIEGCCQMIRPVVPESPGPPSPSDERPPDAQDLAPAPPDAHEAAALPTPTFRARPLPPPGKTKPAGHG